MINESFDMFEHTEKLCFSNSVVILYLNGT